MTTFAVYSNQWEELAESLGERLFHPDRSGIFDKRIIVVPSVVTKRALTLFFARHPRYQIMAGVEWMTLSSGWQELFFAQANGSTQKMPSALELSLKIEEIVLECLHNYQALSVQEREDLQPLIQYLGLHTPFVVTPRILQQVALYSEQLSHLFFQYGLYGGGFLKSWLIRSGWQQWIWKKIFTGGYWTYPLEVAEAEGIMRPPAQLHLFGFHFLPEVYRKVFCQLGGNFYVLSPCALFWEDEISARERISLRRYFQKKQVLDSDIKAWEGYIRDTHPLLSNWGKVGQIFMRNLTDAVLLSDERYVDPSGDSLLIHIQRELLYLQSPSLTAMDASLQIHSVTTPLREIEVLYDQLCHWMKEDPTLTPQDVLVLVPKLDQYVPFIQMIFGSFESVFHYSIESGTWQQGGETLQGISYLLSIGAHPLKSADLLGLFAFPSLLKQWGFSPLQVKRLQRWLTQNRSIDTWLLGLVMTIDEAQVESMHQMPWPAEGFSQTDVDLLNQWVIFLQRLETDLRPIRLLHTQSLQDWLQLLEQWIFHYFKEAEDSGEIYAKIENLKREKTFRSDPIFSSQVLTRLCHAWSIGRACLGSMNQVQRIAFLPFKEGSFRPAKIVWLLGMDESALPRIDPLIPLSEMGQEGEWIPKSVQEDRYLFLEAILSARERLIISYQRMDAQDHRTQSISRLVQEWGEALHLNLPAMTTHHSPLSLTANYLPVARVQLESIKPHPMDPLPNRLIIPFKQLALLARHPIQFYFQQRQQIFLDKEEDLDANFILSYPQQAHFRREARQQTPSLIKRWQAQGKLPVGLFEEVAIHTLQQEWKTQQELLYRIGINPNEIFSIELSLLCDKPVQISASCWICPAVRVSLSDGREAIITGRIDEITPKGFLFHGGDQFEDKVKSQPYSLVLAALNGLPYADVAKILMTKDMSYVEPMGSLRDYLQYYVDALADLSVLMPKWALSLCEGSYADFETQVKLSLESPVFQDKWLSWVMRCKSLPDLHSAFHKWAPYSQRLYACKNLMS